MPSVHFTLGWRLEWDDSFNGIVWRLTNRAKKVYKPGHYRDVPNRARRAGKRLLGDENARKLGILLHPPALILPVGVSPIQDGEELPYTRAECPRCHSIQILDPNLLLCDYGRLGDFDQDATIHDKETLDEIRLTDEQWQMLTNAGKDYGFVYENIVKGKPIALLHRVPDNKSGG